MKVICAWCKKDMGEKGDPSDKRVSHGMCQKCFDEREDNKISKCPICNTILEKGDTFKKGTRTLQNWWCEGCQEYIDEDHLKGE